MKGALAKLGLVNPFIWLTTLSLLASYVLHLTHQFNGSCQYRSSSSSSSITYSGLGECKH